MSLQVLLTNSMRLIHILMIIRFDLMRVPRKLMFMISRWIYRVSIKPFPIYRHLLQENCVEYKQKILETNLSKGKKRLYST